MPAHTSLTRVEQRLTEKQEAFSLPTIQGDWETILIEGKFASVSNLQPSQLTTSFNKRDRSKSSSAVSVKHRALRGNPSVCNDDKPGPGRNVDAIRIFAVNRKSVLVSSLRRANEHKLHGGFGKYFGVGGVVPFSRRLYM